jgi:hypothetical protein
LFYVQLPMTLTSIIQVVGILLSLEDLVHHLLKYNVDVLKDALWYTGYSLKQIKRNRKKFIKKIEPYMFDGKNLSGQDDSLIIYQRTHDQDKDKMVIIGLDVGTIEFTIHPPDQLSINEITEVINEVKKLISLCPELDKYLEEIKIQSSQNYCICCE